GNPSRRLASGNAARDLLPLLKRQRQAASAPLGGSHASTQPDRATNSSGRPLERPADLADRLASLPALPQLPTLLRRVLPPPPRQRTPPAREPKRCCADGLKARKLLARLRTLPRGEQRALVTQTLFRQTDRKST